MPVPHNPSPCLTGINMEEKRYIVMPDILELVQMCDLFYYPNRCEKNQVQNWSFHCYLLSIPPPYPQSQLEIEEERQKVNASILALEEELEGYKEQSDQWKEQFNSTNQE